MSQTLPTVRFWSLIDDYNSRYTTLYMLEQKSYTVDAIRDFVRWMRTQFGRTTDGHQVGSRRRVQQRRAGQVFEITLNQQFDATIHGSRPHLSIFGYAPRSPSRFASGLPISLAALHAVSYLPDRKRTPSLQGCCPAFLQHALPIVPFRL
ncbi:uncharacterized protein LOC134220778 isoform X2 [Armigeres subalbatus]|uniref:uncharacterized protein LOC134220778 isoform X2 n=1 Tax=Armigeres subalbatus TaxID=124917 RepID=UPI002ED1DBD2